MSGIEVYPALATLRFRPAVPDNIQSLIAATIKRHQVLLQGIETECISDLELLQLAVLIVGFDEILPILAVEAAA